MPQLTPVVDSLDTVPEPAREFYVQKDGKFHVDLSGAPAGFAPAADLATANGKVVEFRENNIALNKEVDELRPLKDKLVKFDGIDADAARTAISAQAALDDKGIKKPDDVDTSIATAVAAAMDKIRTEEITPLKTQLTAVTTERATALAQADKLVLKDAIGTKFLHKDVGGIANALDFIIGKADGVFLVENGKLRAASNQFSVARPSEPLPVEEWIERMTKEYPFAFNTSQGGGAPSGNNNNAPKPGQTILRDPTSIQLGDPTIAKQLKEGTLKLEYSQPV